MCKNHRARFRKMNPARYQFPASDFVPFFQRLPGPYCAKPARIRFGSGWLCQVVAKQILPGSKPISKHHRARFSQNPAGPLPVSHFQIRLPSSTDGPEHSMENQPGTDLVLADCVRLGPNGSGPEASRCARIIGPASGQSLRADPARIRIGSCMFTGRIRHGSFAGQRE